MTATTSETPTASLAEALLRQSRHTAGTNDAGQRRASLALTIRHALTLTARTRELAQFLADGDAWLRHHPDPDDEAAWHEAEAEYRAGVDALRDAAAIVFPEAPVPFDPTSPSTYLQEALT